MSPLTDIGPLALVTDQEVRAYLQVEEGDKPTKPLVAILVNGLSARIVQHTGIDYIAVGGDQPSEKMYRYFLSDPRIPIAPAREVSKVEVSAEPNNDNAWLELDPSSGYVLEPLGEAVSTSLRFLLPDPPARGLGWSALAAHVRSPGDSEWPSRERAVASSYTVVRITAKWGYGIDSSVVPDNVKLALLVWLQNLWKRDSAFFSDNVAEVIAGVGMPEDVKELLGEEGTPEAPSVVAV